jgi:hypothetical protein
MKKQLLLLFSIIIPFCIHAQDESVAFKKAMKNGNYKFSQVILNDSTTLDGLIKPINLDFKLGKLIKSDLKIVMRNGTQRVLSASELLSYKTGIHEMISDGNVFCELLLQGKRVGLYKSETVTQIESEYGLTRTKITERLYFKKENGKFIEAKKGGKFRKTFSIFFEDCTDLKDRILNKDLNHDDLEWIFTIYENCK